MRQMRDDMNVVTNQIVTTDNSFENLPDLAIGSSFVEQENDRLAARSVTVALPDNRKTPGIRTSFLRFKNAGFQSHGPDDRPALEMRQDHVLARFLM